MNLIEDTIKMLERKEQFAKVISHIIKTKQLSYQDVFAMPMIDIIEILLDEIYHLKNEKTFSKIDDWKITFTDELVKFLTEWGFNNEE